MPTLLIKADRERRWKQHDRQRQGFYGWALSEALDYRRSEAEKAVEAVREATSPANAIAGAMNAAGKEDATQGLLVRLGNRVAPAFAKPEWERLVALRKSGKAVDDPPEDLWARWVEEYIAEEAAEKVTRIASTVRKDIRSVLAAAFDEGASIDEMGRRLSREIPGINRSRAVVIARTEVISASNQGSHFGARSVAERFGMTLSKEWLDTPDGRTRDAHLAAGAMDPVPYNKPFIVDGEKLMWPGDTSLGASPSNTIQCRCTQAYVPTDEG